MTSRERVLAVLNGKTPDRVPIDLGATDCTSMHGMTYNTLKAHLGIDAGPTRIGHIAMITADIDAPVRERFSADCVRLFYDATKRRAGTLPDGSPCEWPDLWAPTQLPDGSEVLLGVDGAPIAKRMKDTYWFSPAGPAMPFIQTPEDVRKNLGLMEFAAMARSPFFDETLEDIAARARTLREETDYAIVGHFGGHFVESAQLVRGMTDFMCDLAVNPELVTTLMEALAETHMRTFERYIEHVGPYLDVVCVSDDLGMQDGPLISPDTWRKLVKPSAKKLYTFMKERMSAKLFLHSCGSVYDFIPDLIEMGVDILNPVQVSARNMDSKKLKAEFGNDIVFWGGGCDVQRVLPMGTPAEVRDEVKRRIDDFAPGGGFVFAGIHNIQPDVPPENIVAFYDAALEFGGY